MRLSGGQMVEREIELQYVHARLAQEPKQATFRVVHDELADAIFGQIARLGNTGHLEKGRLRRDVRIEAGGRGGDQVLRHRRVRIFLFQGVDVALYAVDQRLVRRPEIRAARIGGVVRRRHGLGRIVGIGGGRRRRPAVKIFVAGERLTDQRGADNLAVLLDQAALRLPGKNDLGNAGYRQRVSQAGDQREGDEHDDRRTDFAQHDLFYTSP